VGWKKVQLTLVQLKIRPYKTTVVHSLLTPDCKARIQYCRWLQELAFNGLLDPELMFYSNKVWCTLSGYVNSQYNRYWSTENPQAVHEVPLHDLKVGVWCAISARRITEPVLLHETINSELYVRLILSPFFDQLTEEKNCMGILCKIMQQHTLH
jgi:hypothetical protein